MFRLLARASTRCERFHLRRRRVKMCVMKLAAATCPAVQLEGHREPPSLTGETPRDAVAAGDAASLWHILDNRHSNEELRFRISLLGRPEPPRLGMTVPEATPPAVTRSVGHAPNEPGPSGSSDSGLNLPSTPSSASAVCAGHSAAAWHSAATGHSSSCEGAQGGPSRVGRGGQGLAVVTALNLL